MRLVRNEIHAIVVGAYCVLETNMNVAQLLQRG